MNYTRGPWKISFDEVYQTYCVTSWHDILTEEEEIDSCNLISAAPDMYEALKLIDELNPIHIPANNSVIKQREEAMLVVRSAIAKAEGSEDERSYAK